MMHQLPYGGSSNLELDLRPESLIAHCTPARGAAIDDLATATSDALLNPVKFPPLSQAVVPGDRVVIALDPDVPQAAQIVAGIVRVLLQSTVEAADITVLQTRADAQVSLAALLPADARQVQFAVHNPDDRGQLAYLAALRDASPILLNRLLCDADLVLPVNLLRPESAFLYCGPHGGLCPAFTDSQTKQRFQTPNLMASRKQQRLRREEAAEVAWLLGIQLSLQIVAGPGDSVLHVLSGRDEDVSPQGHQLVEAAWAPTVANKADLVVATIEGEQKQQSWQNFGRALHAAQQVCMQDGTIILCTDLSSEPGPALKRLASFEDQDRLLQRLGNDRSEDSPSAWLLLEARDTTHVFLLSQLDGASVESLGIGCVDTVEQIKRISSQCSSCILLSDAHRAAPRAVSS